MCSYCIPCSEAYDLFRIEMQFTISICQGRIYTPWHEYIWWMYMYVVLTCFYWHYPVGSQSPHGSVKARRTWRSLWARASCFPARWRATRPWTYRSPGLSMAKSSAKQTDTLNTWEGWVRNMRAMFICLFACLFVCVFFFYIGHHVYSLRVKSPYLRTVDLQNFLFVCCCCCC